MSSLPFYILTLNTEDIHCHLRQHLLFLLRTVSGIYIDIRSFVSQSFQMHENISLYGTYPINKRPCTDDMMYLHIITNNTYTYVLHLSQTTRRKEIKTGRPPFSGKALRFVSKSIWRRSPCGALASQFGKQCTFTDLLENTKISHSKTIIHFVQTSVREKDPTNEPREWALSGFVQS